MYLTKVLLHHILFLLFGAIHFYFLNFNIYITIFTLLYTYAASYYISLWIIKFIFLFPCTKVKTENKCVFITGCDSGFGYHSALLLNKIGFKVFATCLDQNGEGAINLVKTAEHPKKMIIIRMDVTNQKDIEAAYEHVRNYMSDSEQMFGLVNNAGIAIISELEWGPNLADCAKIMDVNCMGMIKVTRQFLPLIRQAKGRILNIESVAALFPVNHAIFYGVSKTAAAGFTDNLRVAMYRFGVPVVSIAPFFYNTPLADAERHVRQYEQSFQNSSEEVRKAYGKNFLLKVKKGLAATKHATSKVSLDVPNTIVSALTVYEPDPRYIVARLVYQPLLRISLWLPKETLEVIFQTITFLFGTHRVYPDD